MQQAAIAFILAIIVEALIEYFGQSIPSRYKPYAAAVVGILVCVAYGADVLAALGFPAHYPYVGSILTGLLIARGANVFNDLVSRLQLWPIAPPAPVPTVAVDRAEVVTAGGNVEVKQ